MNIRTMTLLTIIALAASKSFKLFDFLKNIQKDEEFRSLFIQKTINEHAAVPLRENFFKDLSTTLGIPLIISSGTNTYSLKKQYNDRVLIIVLLDSIGPDLQNLLQYLQHMRSSKTVFLLNNHPRNELKLNELFSFCWENRMINVVAVFQDFQDSPVFYRYTKIPEFTIEKENFAENRRAASYFPNRLRDLKGMYLPVIFGGPEPQIIVSKNVESGHVIKGCMAHFFHALAGKHNARINTSNIHPKLSAYGLRDLVVNGKAEISASVMHSIDGTLKWNSYPCILVSFGIMIPVEHNIPNFKVFAIVFQWDALLCVIVLVLVLSVVLDFASFLWDGKKFSFFNEKCLRGILGQTLMLRQNAYFSFKIIYALIFFFGIMLVTSYQAFLKTLTTSPPTEKKMHSFDDILASQLKVVSFDMEMQDVFYRLPDFKKKYQRIFRLVGFNTFHQLLDSMNTEFAFTVNSFLWNNIQSQQKLFRRPLFRRPEGLFIYNSIRCGFPINENSIYKEIVDSLILETQSSGLMDYWKRISFYELIENGKTWPKDPMRIPQLQPMKMSDLKWVFMAWTFAVFVDSLCFLGELLYALWSKRTSK